MSSKLAPCPFCGEAPAFREDDGRWLVVCNDVYCGRGQDTASTQRKAANLWNRQWADRRAREFLRLKRENEKYRRKLLKRRAMHVLRQYPKRTIPEGVNYLRKSVLNTPDKIFYIRLGFQGERNRNPGLRKFIRWQEAFCPIAARAQDPDAVEVAACFAPSQKIDFSGIEELAVKGKP